MLGLIMQFYILKPEDMIRFGTTWAYADQVDPVQRGKVVHRCPVCGNVVSGLEWIMPHRIKLSSSKPEKWGDFLWGAGFSLMVSGQFKSLYESSDLSGIEEFSPPVEVVRIGRKRIEDVAMPPPPYHLVKIKWNGANLDDSASKVVRDNIRCAYCRSGITKSLERVIIQPDSWNGSDIFIARGLSGQFIVSERFKDVVELHKLKNAKFILTENYAYDVKKSGGWYLREEIA
jgi:hypothetical protein